ncbi:MAG: hypothetical protein ACOX6A_02965 [Atribacter sp.]
MTEWVDEILTSQIRSSECSVLIVKSKLLQDYFLVLSNEDHKDNHFLILQRLVLRAYWRLL